MLMPNLWEEAHAFTKLTQRLTAELQSVLVDNSEFEGVESENVCVWL